MISVLLGHQGGWDEALLVLVPIGLFVGLLALANRRARALQAKRRADRIEHDSSDPRDSPFSPDSPDSPDSPTKRAGS